MPDVTKEEWEKEMRETALDLQYLVPIVDNLRLFVTTNPDDRSALLFDVVKYEKLLNAALYLQTLLGQLGQQRGWIIDG